MAQWDSNTFLLVLYEGCNPMHTYVGVRCVEHSGAYLGVNWHQLALHSQCTLSGFRAIFKVFLITYSAIL